MITEKEFETFKDIYERINNHVGGSYDFIYLDGDKLMGADEYYSEGIDVEEIPLRYLFISLEEREREIIEKRDRGIEADKKAREERERKDYERLKQKFEE